MENIYRIARLIQRYLLGKASVEEGQEVKDWVVESERHKELFEIFEQESYWDIQQAEHEIFDEEKGYRRFIHAKRMIAKRRIFRRVASVAAVLMLVVGIGGGGWILFREKREMPLTKLPENSIAPGERKAILVLNGGEQINLKDAVQVQVVDNKARILVVGDSTRLVAKSDSIVTSFHTIFTPVGGEYNLTLSDGTRVWLNASSRLLFPAVFQEDRREVQVEGEVYFEVSKDSLHPFWVRTGDVTVKVLGTSFNVRAYPDEEYKTTLVEGSVMVDYLGKVMEIKPGEQWILEKEGPRVYDAKLKSVISWRNGDFAFEDQPLTKVFDELERWYGIHVFVSNEIIQDLKFTGIFPRYENIEEVLHIIELATCVKCNINGETVTVRMEY